MPRISHGNVQSHTGKRFWQKVVVPHKQSDCWRWLAAKTRQGRAMYQGISAARVMWLLMRGTIPDGRWVLHTCDNPECVNPEHLFLGTAKDNTQDMNKKLRGCHGSKSPNAKLSEATVRNIRKQKASGWTYKELIDKYHVSVDVLLGICKHRRWKHVA